MNNEDDDDVSSSLIVCHRIFENKFEPLRRLPVAVFIIAKHFKTCSIFLAY
jgi:hypothetical protein